jgi:hypothetical protein
LLGYQRFKAEGLQAFSGFSTDQANFTNNGYDSATGFGARIGYFGNLTKELSVGAAYSTKIAMSETVSETEKDKLINHYSSAWTDKGTAWYVLPL